MIENEKMRTIEIIDYLNRKTSKKYRHSKAHLTVISARLKEGFTLDDCKRVIDTKTAQWLNDKKEKKGARRKGFDAGKKV